MCITDSLFEVKDKIDNSMEQESLGGKIDGFVDAFSSLSSAIDIVIVITNSPAANIAGKGIARAQFIAGYAAATSTVDHLINLDPAKAAISALRAVKELLGASAVLTRNRRLLVLSLLAGELVSILEKAEEPLGNLGRDFSQLLWDLAHAPLPLDLNGDGKLSTVGTDGGINFDFNGDGLAGNTGWVGKDDGLLVFDANQDGNVTNGSELFGDNFIIGQKVLEDGTIENIYAKHGFEALASLDTNKDGVVDANDKDFDKIKVWQDKNGNGKVDAGEMLTLKELGIKGLNTGLMGGINFIQHATKAEFVRSMI